ncbi:MAG: hypothetical protein IKC64_05805, partial [Clostridia bacterium]|nr:hypothetical protein [Clostridia bacterium]
YHKRFSLFECDHTCTQLSPASRSKYAEIGRKIINLFWPQMTDISIVDGDSETGLENIYCVFLRMSISCGTGEARPVLCKVFFRQEKGMFVPIRREEAQVVAEELEHLANQTNPSNQTKTDGSMIALALTALENLTSDKSGEFDRCVYFESGPDCATTNEFIIKGPNNFVTIECSEIKPLGIAHVKWRNDSVVIMHGGKNMFYLVADESGTKYTLRCAGCQSAPIIRNNVILVGEGDEQISYTIDPSKDNLGLSDADIKLIKDNGAVAEHYAKISCNAMSRRLGRACEKFVCNVNAQNFGDQENPVLRCADCPYPEIVYTDENGERKLTSTLIGAVNENGRKVMVEKKGVFTCDLCGRTFVNALSKKMSGERYCTFCANVVKKLNGDVEPTTQERETYNRYAQALPVLTRAFTGAKRKFAFERDDAVFFIVGNKVYKFDKWALVEGKVKSPKIIMRRSN